MENLEKIYDRRFSGDMDFRNRMYRALCEDFFQQYIPEDSTVLDVAAGYCEFINNIKAKKKIALDINPDTAGYAGKDVEVVTEPSTDMSKIGSAAIDAVFVSNFFEHLNKADISATLREIYRVLRKGGRLLILQPNFRYCHKDYWMFFDHITELDDRSLSEALEINNFKIIECRPKFLPYTTKSRFPKSIFLVRLYLKIGILQKILGKQAFICAEKK